MDMSHFFGKTAEQIWKILVADKQDKLSSQGSYDPAPPRYLHKNSVWSTGYKLVSSKKKTIQIPCFFSTILGFLGWIIGCIYVTATSQWNMMWFWAMPWMHVGQCYWGWKRSKQNQSQTCALSSSTP